IGTSVFEQVLWGIEALGVSDLWKATTSPFKLRYKPTGQVILFRGLDKAKKLKSIKVAKGYLKYLWFEELDEFAGEEEIRSVQQSVMRGGSKFVVFKSFNPPISRSNWANEYVLKPRANAVRHMSCYKDVPREWLGEQFFEDANELLLTNPRAYTHEYLGIPVGTGGEVFDNLCIRPITDQEISIFDNIFMGIDWGWYPDPYHWGKMHYDSTRKILYIYDEMRCYKTSNAETWNRLVMEKHVTGQDLITADSAEPKSVGDYRDYGSLCRGAIKGPDSVRYGIKWLQSLNQIVIDPIRCPETSREFQNYEYERTDDGEIISGYPDHDNHSIDCTRYALERVWKRKGQ
ncbi:MAG: phage terminase large subunit, partial [Lachnospiraceae bacterium]|nr:phage terminase large subunit [Lachnospiraceae bacterium]